MVAPDTNGVALPVTGTEAMAVEARAPAVSGAVRQVGAGMVGAAMVGVVSVGAGHTVGAGRTGVTAGATRDHDGPEDLDVEVMAAAWRIVDSVAVTAQVADSAVVQRVTVIMGAAPCVADAGRLMATATRAEGAAVAALVSEDLLIVDLVVGGKADPPVVLASGAALVGGEAENEGLTQPAALTADPAVAIAGRVLTDSVAGGSSAVGHARMTAQTAATTPVGAVLVGGAAIEGQQAIAVPPTGISMTGRLPVEVANSPALATAMPMAAGSAASIGATAVSAAAGPLGPASLASRAMPTAAMAAPLAVASAAG